MNASRRYDVSGLIEAQYEAGSRGRVLRNLLGIKRAGDMELAESQALELAQRQAIGAYSQEHRFTAADVCRLHAIWLGPIYAWAGEYRAVNITKDGFPFAAAGQVPRLILIHPFREGNGRVVRLLALLMGLQAGLPPLDFSPLAGRGLKRYVAGIHAATGRDYRLLIDLFRKVIDRTWKNASSSGRRAPQRLPAARLAGHLRTGAGPPRPPTRTSPKAAGRKRPGRANAGSGWLSQVSCRHSNAPAPGRS